MPLLIVLVPLVMLALVLLVPVSLVQRYRVGTRRQRARGWLAAVNQAGFALSLAVAWGVAALSTRWLPGALEHALGGTAAGCVLGLVGLLSTRWEARPEGLHYTPSRTLVLSVMLVVTGRLLYGWMRVYHGWTTRSADAAWLAQAGAEGSIAAGALVLAYYFTFWAGIRRRIAAQR